MKKLGNKKGKVHPSPPAPTMSFLPASILTLAAALSPEDREVLAYLISCCGNCNNRNDTAADDHRYYKTTHEPSSDCNCFRCYKSFWARWDESPNRQLIHEIIEAHEEGSSFREGFCNVNESSPSPKKKKKKSKKKRGSSKRVCSDGDEFKTGDQPSSPEAMMGSSGHAAAGDVDEDDAVEKVEEEKAGSVTKVVSFLGDRIWNFWNIN